VIKVNRFVLLPIVIMTAVSSFTLWLVEDPIKYFFFIFQIILTAAFVWLFISPTFDVKSPYKKHNMELANSLQAKHLNYFFLFSSVSLLLINVFNFFTPVNVLLAFIVVSLLPGYVILRLTGIFNKVSFLAAIVLSYVLSVALSGFIPVLFPPLIDIGSRFALLFVIALFSTLPIIKDRLIKTEATQRKISVELSPISLLTLLLTAGFFLITIIYLYPQMGLVPGLDIDRNLTSIQLFSLSPTLISSLNPSFLIYQAAIYTFSISTPILYQTFMAFTSISVILSFYMMAKKYLEEIDTRLPFFATAFWAFFSGFGWIYLFQNKLGQPTMTQIGLLAKAYDATYADVGYGLSSNLWFWFIAMTASFSIFFTLLYLLKCKNIPKTSLIPLISILVIALSFIHAPELVMFAILLVVLAFLGSKIDLRVDEALFSTFIALIGTLGLSYFVPTIFGPLSNEFNLLTIGLSGLVGLTCLFKFLKRNNMDFRERAKFFKVLAYAFIVFFTAGLLYWFPSASTFSMSSVGNIFLVPWFFYPVRLGIIGFLGLLGIIIIADKYSDNTTVVFPFLFFTAWTLGRIVSFVNINLFNTSYYEWRFIFFSFAAVSITSALFLKFLQKKLTPTKSLRRLTLTTFLISILVLVGISSTFLTIENWSNFSTQNKLDENQLNAISFLTSNLSSSQLPPLLTITPQSLSTLEFVPSTYLEQNIQPIIWSSKSPEIPLAFLNNLRFSPTVIYLDQKDLVALSSTDLQNSYVGGFFIQSIKPIYSNPEVRIYQSPSGVPPLQNGESTLVLDPNEIMESDKLASYLLSLGGYNYTTMLNSDSQIAKQKTLIFPSDSMTISDLNRLGLDDGQKVIILNSDGYGQMARVFLESGDNAVTAKITSGENVFLYDLANETLGLKSISEASFFKNMEFVTYNDEQNENYLPIVSEDQTEFWNWAGGAGLGNVSAPLLKDDPTVKIGDPNSLKVVIEEGNYSDWFFEKQYAVPQDWSQKEFMSIWWYGTKSGQDIGFLASDKPWKNYFQYNFVDNFLGWQHIIIPLNEFESYGNPEWSSIVKFQIRSLNGGTPSTLHLGSIGLEDGNDASIEITITNATNLLPKLSIFDGSAYIPITLPNINSSSEIPGSNLYFTDGSNADQIFGMGYSGEVQMKRIEDVYTIDLSLRLCPKDSPSSQCRFRLDYLGETINASSLIMNKTETPLPVEIPSSIFTKTVGSSVIGWYSNKSTNVPLIASRNIGNAELYYVNVYPIISSALTDKNSSQNLFQIVANVFDSMGLSKYDKNIPSWVIEDSNPVFAFKEASLQGNISMLGDSLIPSEKLDLPKVFISTNNDQILLRDVISLSVQNTGGKIAITSRSVTIKNGVGFYPLLDVYNAQIKITGEKILVSAKTSNGTSINSQSLKTMVISINGNLSAYVRNPSIEAFGNASFQDAYAFHSYLGNLQTLGKDIAIEGEINFSLPLSDEYSLCSNFSWIGNVMQGPPAFTWNELASLQNSAPYFILVIIIFSIIPIFKRIKQR
jgi:hypothetical protein